jgi:alpha,alpha-trehalase
MGRIFPDGKTFVDAEPDGRPGDILRLYDGERGKPGFDLRAFVRHHFIPTAAPDSGYRSTPGLHLYRRVVDHSDPRANKPEPYSSLLPLPNPYVVPGGRFEEAYY